MDARALIVLFAFAGSSLKTQSPAVFSSFGAGGEHRFSTLWPSYDGQGYWLAQKRLSKGQFAWWPESELSGQTSWRALTKRLLMVAGDVSRVRAAPMWRRVSEQK